MSRSTLRVLALFELLAASREGMTLMEMSRALDAPKGSLWPVLLELEDAQFLIKESSRYRLGPKLWRLGLSANMVGDDDTLMPSMLTFLMENVRRALKAHGITFFLWDNAEQMLKPLYSYSITSHHSVALRSGEGLAGHVWQKREPILLDDYMKWEHALPGFRTSEWRSHIGAPLRHNGDVIGVIIVRSHDASLKFTSEDVETVLRLIRETDLIVSTGKRCSTAKKLSSPHEMCAR